MINKVNKLLIIIIIVLIILLLLAKFRGNNNGTIESFTTDFNWYDVNGIMYINLENRSDRNKVLLEELDKLDVPKELIHRIDAVYTPGNGHKGCVQSHIKAIKYAKSKGWKYFLILEDDFELSVDPSEYKAKMASIVSTIKKNDNWDLILLAPLLEKRTNTDFSPDLDRITEATTSSAYILNSTYINTLLSCFEYCDKHMTANNTSEYNHEPYALDQQWKQLQVKDRWFSPKIKLSKQRDIWSSTLYNIGNTILNGQKEQFTDTENVPEILYINLDNRTDRNKQLLAELDKLSIPKSKIHRVSAVYMPKNGHKGCVQSHIKALNMVKSKGWLYAVILEDDFELAVAPSVFKDDLAKMADTLLKNNQDWDVIMLATAYSVKEPVKFSKDIVRIIRATTSSAYIINATYIDKLLECFRECDSHMLEDKVNDQVNGLESYALDQQWAKLQKVDNWFGFKVDPSKQRAVWSSIQSNIHSNINNTNKRK